MGAALLIVSLGGYLGARELLAVKQPIAFNHKKHLDAGLDCAACHVGVADGRAHATIPNIDLCITCHGSDDNPKTQIVRDYAAAGRKIAWQRVYQVPAYVYFSHERHVGIAKLDCAVCHGDMTKREAPVTSQAVPLRMARCLSCHRERGVTTDCLACHR